MSLESQRVPSSPKLPQEWFPPETGRRPQKKQHIKKLQTMLDMLEQQLCEANAAETYRDSPIVQDIVNVSALVKDQRSIRY